MEKSFTTNYLEYIKSDGWRKKANARKKRDGNRCVMCGTDRNLHVHHINYRHLKDEDVENDLITLCCECHEAVHENKDYVISGIIMAYTIQQAEEHEGFYEILNRMGIRDTWLKMIGPFEPHMKVLAIPIPGEECGAIIIPFYDLYTCEKDLKRMCERTDVDFYDTYSLASKIYYAALEDGGYIADIPAVEESA